MAYTICAFFEYVEGQNHCLFCELNFPFDSMTIDILGQSKKTPAIFKEKGMPSDASSLVLDEYKDQTGDIRFTNFLNTDEFSLFLKKKEEIGAGENDFFQGLYSLMKFYDNRDSKPRIVYWLRS